MGGSMRYVSVWAYPWDLYDLGPAQVVEMLTREGVDTISLATSYHAGRFLQPGNPRRRVYFPQDGTVYYTVDPARWTDHEIKPLQADIVATEGDMLALLCDQRKTGGPKVSCWTVCLHNTRLGMAHPDHVMRTAHGDPHFYALCPSSPAARAYVTGMIAEIAERYGPNRIELESPDFMGFDHGFHHEKDGLGLLPEDTFLLGICFCAHCMDRAAAAGVPATAAKEQTAKLLDAAFDRALPHSQFPDFPAVGIDAFAECTALHAYLMWRSEPVTTLLQDIMAAAQGASEVLLIDGDGSWAGGVDIATAAAVCDGVLHCAYTTTRDRIGPLMEKARALLGPDKTLIAGFQLFHPEVADAADLAGRTAAAAPYVDGVNYYNLGLVPKARLKWISQALGSLADDHT